MVSLVVSGCMIKVVDEIVRTCLFMLLFSDGAFSASAFSAGVFSAGAFSDGASSVTIDDSCESTGDGLGPKYGPPNS